MGSMGTTEEFNTHLHTDLDRPVHPLGDRIVILKPEMSTRHLQSTHLILTMLRSAGSIACSHKTITAPKSRSLQSTWVSALHSYYIKKSGSESFTRWLAPWRRGGARPHPLDALGLRGMLY